MAQIKRRRKWIDNKLQGALCLRLLFYWVFCVVSLCLTGFVWQMFTDVSVLFQWSSRDIVGRCVPVIAGALLLVPVLLFDCIELSNRFAGPVYRLRNEMRKLAAGQTVAPIHFRNGDFWYEMADDFNRLSARVQELEARLAESDGADQSGSKPDLEWQTSIAEASAV